MADTLSERDKRWLVLRVQAIMLDYRNNSASAWLGSDLDKILWYWSVDGSVADVVRRDAFAPPNGGRSGFKRVSHTAAARKAYDADRKISRDHVVPKKVIRELLGQELWDEFGIYELLSRFCFVAYITKEEHGQLLSDRMPEGWDVGEILQRDPWARYRKAGLADSMHVIGNVENIDGRIGAPPSCCP